jgi:hypothetical protein
VTDLQALKKRRTVMMIVNVAAALAALGSALLYIRGETWAGAGFVVALLLGFGTQIWFIAGLRGGKGGA